MKFGLEIGYWFNGIVLVTFGFPWVSVPVLSNITVLILCAVSSASASLIRIPCSAPIPVPTIIAVGVAKPIAHGQAMIRTATVFSTANKKEGVGPATYQITKVTIASMMTTGTKYEEIISANL